MAFFMPMEHRLFPVFIGLSSPTHHLSLLDGVCKWSGDIGPRRTRRARDVTFVRLYSLMSGASMASRPY